MEPVAPSRVCAVIPVLNEAGAIGPTVRSLPHDVVGTVIVVDGGSSDETVSEAQAAGATVLLEARRGYGRACQTGVDHAESLGAEIVLFLDGDGADAADQAGRLIGPLLDGSADFVLADRSAGVRDPGSMGAHQILAGRVIGAVVGVIAGVRYRDMCAFRAIRVADLRRLGMREMTYGWNLEMQIRAARAGLRVREVGLPYHRRIAGSSKVAGSLRGTMVAGQRILRTLVKVGVNVGLARKVNAAAPADEAPSQVLEQTATDPAPASATMRTVHATRIQGRREGQPLHPWSIRVMHWINAIAMFVMISSGWGIYNDDVIIRGLHFSSSIRLGEWAAWSLNWHFAGMWLLGMNGVCYLAYGVLTGRLRERLWPIRLNDVIHTVKDTLHFKIKHEDLTTYNAVQKLLYIVVILASISQVLTGLAIWKPVQFSGFVGLLGGFQYARLVHFAGMAVIAGFVLVHVLLALLVPQTLWAMLAGGPRVDASGRGRPVVGP